MSEVQGGCLCGGLRYTLKSEPKAVVLCHCTHCQKSSGSAFSVNVAASDADLVFAGELATYADKADSGNILNRRFCPKCGSSIGSQSAARPGIFILKAGSLDDASVLRNVAAQIWTRSAQPWVKFAFETPSFENARA